MSRQKIIDVQHLGVTFGDRRVLHDVNLSIYQGEVSVILGGSGSGKTTVLKHILGLYPIQEGSIMVLDKNISNLDEEGQTALYHKMGVFFQNGALLNSLSVGENVGLPLEQHSKLSEMMIEHLVRLKLSLVNLDDAYDLFPSQLSGGMLKRAALARAIIMDPPLLFCDEPGAGLDPVSLASLDNLIQELKKQLGMTVILVTHEVASIRRIADRIIFLENGNVLFEGSLQDALDSNQESIRAFFSKSGGDGNQ